MRDTASWYRTFGEVEARGQSAIYEEWALSVSEDAPVLALIDQLPLQKRQPNLVFACSRLLGAPEGPYAGFRDWLVHHWPSVAAETAHRSTQTNEARRCASLLPALAMIPGPLALLEVGASAGLCLYPDRYSYRYDGGEPLHPSDGPSTVLLECATNGLVPVPTRLPEIAWRAGIDLAPLDVSDAGDTLWLQTLVWPEQHERRDRLRAAIAIARLDAPRLVRGDAIDALPALAAEAPAGATLVVVASAVLVYLPAPERMRFVETVRALGVDWVSLEGVGGLPAVQAAIPADGGPPGRFVLALNERPLAWTGPHGQSLDWFAGESPTAIDAGPPH
ncbi:DUF2332 domain-containing protein [Lacisediminihabitans sp.]|uniref:DUF2332 domain-containing protein n=1 Tax=Lacisediminihabitans sp. TaxID=2787631 RepID=UPI00374CB2DE